MPDFKEQKRGFMMEPKGVYKKYTCKRGMPKYGLTDPNEAPTMKATTHLGGTEREHIHKERPSHGNTEEAHGPMQAGQTAGQVVRRERLMTKRTKSEAKADAIEGGFPEEKANKVFAKHKKPFYKNGKYAMRKDYKMGDVKGSPSQDQQANKMSQMSYTDDYANKSLKQLVSDEKAIHSGKFNLSTNPDGKNKKGQDNYGDIQDRRHKNKNVVRAYRDQQQNVNRGRDSLGNPITKKYKK